MPDIKPIQTEYKGYLFRSRLEARWAVFFDSCGVKWDYEQEGYDVGGGIKYLPDFILYNVTVNHGIYKEGCNVYVEVKGQMTDLDALKINSFYNAGCPDRVEDHVPKTAILVVGSIPAGDNIDDVMREIRKTSNDYHQGWPSLFNFQTIDGDYFTSCPGVNKKGVFNLFGGDSNYLCSMDDIRTEHAYRIARQARFEFGETPRLVGDK